MEKVKKKKKVGKYDELECQKDSPVGDMRKQQFIGTPGILYAVQSTEPIDIFEMMITDEPVEYITNKLIFQTKYFRQDFQTNLSCNETFD